MGKRGLPRRGDTRAKMVRGGPQNEGAKALRQVSLMGEWVSRGGGIEVTAYWGLGVLFLGWRGDVLEQDC